MNPMIRLAENRRFPDALVRFGIRRLLRERAARLRREDRDDRTVIDSLAGRPLAEDTDAANRQHYEVPTRYFETVLGARLKYSSGYWPDGCSTLDASEEAMLRLTCERAGIRDGDRILELGCGWGSLTLWMAEHFPGSAVTAVSNSRTQREFIERRCSERGFTNVTVITADINGFEPDGRFDRVVSVEMFEHVRNHSELFKRIDGWLEPGGRLFVHVFAHHKYAYLFESEGAKDWMADLFFSGGIMPSATLLPACAGPLELEEAWTVNGAHYSRTLEAWLAKHDAAEDAVREIFADTYGAADAALWSQRWRMFYMACSELFAMNGGEEWLVMHYRFAKRDA